MLVPLGRGKTSGCGVIPVDSAGQGGSSPSWAPEVQCNEILGAVRLQILLYEGICCSEGFGCAALLAV